MTGSNSSILFDHSKTIISIQRPKENKIMAIKFKKGDRVRYIGTKGACVGFERNLPVGAEGTVIDDSSIPYVSMDVLEHNEYKKGQSYTIDQPFSCFVQEKLELVAPKVGYHQVVQSPVINHTHLWYVLDENTSVTCIKRLPTLKEILSLTKKLIKLWLQEKTK